MTWIVTLRPRAEQDLRQAKDWYDAQRPGLGDELFSQVKLAIRSLEQCPEGRPLYYLDFRRLLTKRFPYKIFYRIQGDRVIVFRILHSRRHHPAHLR